MGILDNWFGGSGSPSGGSATATRSAESAASAVARAEAANADGPSAPLELFGVYDPVIRDYTTKPNIDPALLQKIMPRDGPCELTVSGLDGVLTVGRDMVMTTDQAIHCQTLRVLGTLEATVFAQSIIIAEGARVIGSVRANDADIRGEFDGSLQVRGKVSLHKTASIFGKIRALELAINKDALVHGADIKRVVPRVFDDQNPQPICEGRFDDGYSSMCITVSQNSTLRR
jgi:cytoskeletal protein CcmA (bactofilin family)